MVEQENRLGDFRDDLPIGHVVFVIATRPTRLLEVEFAPFEVDGLPKPLSYPGQIPGEQGLWIDIGAFPAGKEIEVRWRFRSGIQVPDDEVRIGHCPNGKLTKLVRLEDRVLERFRNYEGVFQVVPQKF